MRLSAWKLFWVLLLPVLFLMPPGVFAQKQLEGPPPGEGEKEQLPEVPGLAELMVKGNELSKRLTVLETKSASGFDLNPVKENLQAIEARLERFQAPIERLKKAPTLDFTTIWSYRDTLSLTEGNLAEITTPLTRAIQQLEGARDQWLAESKRWQEWQSVLLTDEAYNEIKPTLAEAQNTIDSALLVINQELKTLLPVFQKSGSIGRTINSLNAELDRLTQARRRDLRVGEVAPILSLTYLTQLKNLTWFDVAQGIQNISWPNPEFFKTQGRILVLRIFTALAVILLIFRRRPQLMESERWRFLAKRPIAAGIVFGTFPFRLLMAVVPPLLFFLEAVVGGLAYVRLLGGLIGEFWKKLLLYILLIFIILLRFFQFINLPQPLIQLYIFLAAPVGLALCSWRAVVSAREDSPLTTWAFGLGGVLFFLVVVAELGGYTVFAKYLMSSVLQSVAYIIITWLVIYLACGGVEVLVHSTLLQKVALVREHTEGIIRQSSRTVKLLIGGLTGALLLSTWEIYGTPAAAIRGIWSWGVTIGSQKITVGLVLTAAACLYGAFILSWVFQSLLMRDVAVRKKVDPRAQQSLASLINYGVVFVGFLVALVVLGIDLTQITIVLGALGVGIGFGLQQVVNNLVCGIILLIERPIRPGDYIELPNGHWAEVKRIGVRATRVLTFDRADIWIPNAELITQRVVNWTFSDRYARLRFPVRVALGSDTNQVIKVLLEVADEDPAVTKAPKPFAFFNGYGDGWLNFELWLHLQDLDIWFTVFGRIYQAIDRKLREAGIEIPFPPRDLHLRSVDQPVVMPTVSPP